MTGTKHLEWLSLYPSLLVSGIAGGALKSIHDLERDNATMRGALDRIACWHDGYEVNGCFDEPSAAHIARMALGKCEEVDE